MSADDYKTIDQQVGLVGGTVLLMGTVIGITVFLLPGELMADEGVGPEIFLALLLTALPMTFAVLALLQLGGAIPVAGGIYVYASRLLSPFWGFLAIWLMVPAIWAVFLFTAHGFAEFTNFFVDLPETSLMIAVLAAFFLINLMGITLVTQVQLVMVLAILFGMLVFILPGATAIDTSYYGNMFPEGPGPFIVALVSLYIPFQGFTMIIELGEEMKNPVKNIPRVMGLGMFFSVLMSVALVFVFAGTAHHEVLAGYGGRAVAESSLLFLPDWGAAIVAFAALLGAFTTINSLLTSYSRTIMRAGRDEMIPSMFSNIHPVSDVPHWAIIMLGLPPILIAPISPGPVPLTIFLALILLFANILMGLALWRLPKRYPQRYEYSLYKLPMPLLKFTSVAVAGISTVFWLGTFTELPEIVGVIVALIVLGYALYRYRVWFYDRRGVDLKERLGHLHDHE